MSPPHFDCLPETPAPGEELALGLDVALSEGDGLGFGFGVRVTSLGAARVTSNCTSFGVDPRAAA
jgi:hypothetical protein